jgi:serpin B
MPNLKPPVVVTPTPALIDQPVAPADAAAVAAAPVNEFACDFYSKIHGANQNLIFSPYSIDVALSMVYTGARGDTATEMADALHYSGNAGADADATAGLVQLFQANQKDNGYELHVADALWGAKGVAWTPAYLTKLKSEYLANLQSLDFNDEPVARKTINDWVSQQTADKIKDLIPAGAINGQTRLVLTNAVYFKGDWASPFEASSSNNSDFHVDGKDAVVPAMTMSQTGQFQYMENDDLQALQMPYQGGNLAMLILLPKKQDGLVDLDGKIDAKLIGQQGSVIAQLKPARVQVELPKFKLETSLDLMKTLADLGIKKALTPAADFSGMDGSHDLMIGAAIHKAYINVDEKGTEAAAATGIMMRAMAMAPMPSVPFIANHPFVFVLRDMKTGVILFMGKVTDPRG